MNDAVTPAPQNPAVDAKLLLDSTAKLMLAEREMVRQVRDYATKNGIGADAAQAYIQYLNGASAAPAWLQQASTGGVAHKDSREILAITNMQTERDALVVGLRTQSAKFGLNADAAINAMRSALTHSDPKADETVLSMLNASGNVAGKPASAYLTTLVFETPLTATAWLNGIDKGETFGRWFTELKDKVVKTASQAVTAVKDAAAPVIGAAQEGAATATEQGGSWFGNGVDWVKDKTKNLSFGGIAGGVGIGALFYLIANALGGNSWFGKIVGVMAGIFGAKLGFDTFGGGNRDQSNAPGRSVSAIGAQHEGNIETRSDPSTLRDENRRNKAPVSFVNPADANRDGILTDEELLRYRDVVIKNARQINGFNAQHGQPLRDFDPASLVPNAPAVGSSRTRH